MYPSFGHPAELSQSILPWCSDVFNYFSFGRQNISNGEPNPTIRKVAKVVWQGILIIWNRSSVVKWRKKLDKNGDFLLEERTNIISEKRIIEKIENIYKDGLKLLKWQEDK